MFRRFSVNFAVFSMILDAAIAALALALAVYLRPMMNRYLDFAAHYPEVIPIPPLLYVLFPLVWVSVFMLMSVYDGRRNLRAVDEFTSLTLGSLLATVSMAGMLYLSFREISRLLFLTFVGVAFAAMLAWRIGWRALFRLSEGRNAQKRNVLIIGAGPVGREVQARIRPRQWLGLRIAGFLDDDPGKQAQPDVLGNLSEARRIVLQNDIDDIVIALPQRAYKRTSQLVVELHDLPVKVWVIPDYVDLALHRATIEDFAGIPMLDLRAPALNDYQRMVKRAFDLFVTVGMLPLSLILMGSIALIIKLQDGGPVLFRQMRVGENGRLFEMFKFRTMLPEAEALRSLVEELDDDGNLLHKRLDDPRVTPFGRFLRRTSLDELPQIINILRGDMSLVGPRPELPYLVDRYEPWQRKRFAVPQGVTGWWQVNGRSDRPMHLHTEDDLYYVQNYSLWLDILILLKTIGVVMRGTGAY